MKSSDLPDDVPYDWANVRKWLISYLQIYLKYSEMPSTRNRVTWLYESWKKLPQIYSRRMKKLPDGHADFIVDYITTCLYEPDTFSNSVTGAKALLALLEKDLPPEAISKEVQRICDRI